MTLFVPRPSNTHLHLFVLPSVAMQYIKKDGLLLGGLALVQNRIMPSADSGFQEFASVKGSLFLLQKAPSIRHLSLFSYEVNPPTLGSFGL